MRLLALPIVGLKRPLHARASPDSVREKWAWYGAPQAMSSEAFGGARRGLRGTFSIEPVGGAVVVSAGSTRAARDHRSDRTTTERLGVAVSRLTSAPVPYLSIFQSVKPSIRTGLHNYSNSYGSVSANPMVERELAALPGFHTCGKSVQKSMFAGRGVSVLRSGHANVLRQGRLDGRDRDRLPGGNAPRRR